MTPIEQNKQCMNKFISTSDIDYFYAGYVQMINIMYNRCVTWLTYNVSGFAKSSQSDETVLQQCKVFSKFISQHGITIDDIDIKRLIALRNKLVHETNAILNVKDNVAINYSSYMLIDFLSNEIYKDDACTKFLQHACNTYNKTNLKGTPKSDKSEENSEIKTAVVDTSLFDTI